MNFKTTLCLFLLACTAAMSHGKTVWTTEGFNEFNRGTFGNSGDNIYVSAKGVLQRIRQSDINNDGYSDILICNSQEHEEYVMPTFYSDILNDPSKQTRLRIGGANWDIAVGDLNKDGYEDVVIPCKWNGSSWVPNNTIFYGSEKGITNHYAHALPVSGGRAEIGDFNGDGWKDIIFVNGSIDKFTITFLPNSEKGFLNYFEYTVENPELKQTYGDINNIHSVQNGRTSTLLLRISNGAVATLKFNGNVPEKKVSLILPRDPAYTKTSFRWSNENQFVSDTTPKLRSMMIKGKLYVFAARVNDCALYPFVNGRFDIKNAIKFNVPKAYSITAGDVRKKGFNDIVIVARAAVDNKECSFYYPASAEGVWREKDRVPIFSYRAADAILADLGGKYLSLAVFESNTGTNYSGKVLLYKEFKGAESLKNAPAILPNGDARIALAPRMKKHQHLLVANTRSGNATSKLPVYIYPGSNKGFSAAERIDLDANGAMDGLFADLNDDGKPDLILANEVEMAPQLNDGSYIYYNLGGTFSSIPDLKLHTERATGVVISDFDRNGYLDMAFTSLDDPELTLYYGGKNNTYRKVIVPFSDKLRTLWLTGADVNNDGYLDLIVPVTEDGMSFVLYGSKNGFDYKNRYNFNVAKSQTCRVADVNNDGYIDIIFAGSYPSLGKPLDTYVSIYYGSKKGFDNSRRTMLPCNNSNTLAVADFNNDGLLDIFIGAYDNRRTRELDSHIYWNDAKDGFVEDNRTCFRTEASCGAIVADFNNDGWKDLALVNHKIKTQHNAYSQIWYNNKGKFSLENTTKLPSKGAHGMISAPHTNAMDRSASEFYTGRIFDLKGKCSKITAKAEMFLPHECKVNIYLRSAANKEKLMSQKWQQIAFDKEINADKFPGRFYQYRLELIAPDGIGTPRINKVEITFQ